MTFLLIHGSFGSPQGNWFPELKDKLEALGQRVIVPSFPVEDWDEVTENGPKVPPSHQSLTAWLKVVTDALAAVPPHEPLCVVAHSLGCLFLLHAVQHHRLTLDSAIFVSPFLHPLEKAWQFDHVNASFYKNDFDFRSLIRHIPVSYVLYSENDPYVEKDHSMRFARRLKSSLLFVKHAGHMNAEVNLNEFPLVFELCKTRLDLSLYQKYLAHRRELYAIDYVNPRSEEVIYLEPHEVFDEGVFKFRNLRKSGFCTLLTSVPFWDTHATYYQESRAAAQRIKNFTRVFVVAKNAHLTKHGLLEHIKLDLAAGIQVYLCTLADIKAIGAEPDFGIWDNDYLCMVRFAHNEPREVQLSSRKKDIQEALEWQKKILQVAMPLHDLAKDIPRFVRTHTVRKKA